MENNIISKLSTPLLIILILVILSIMVLTPVLNMIILGIILSLGVNPIAKRLNNKIKHKSISNILGMLLIIIPIILLLGYIVYVMIGLSTSIISSQGNFSSFNVNSIASGIVNYLPPQYHSMSGTIAIKIYTGVNSLTKIVFNYIISLVKDLPNISIQLLVLIFTTFYFARDGDKVWDYVFAFIPDDRVEFFNHMFAQIKDVLKSIFYGHVLTSVIIGLMGFVGYTLLGYPFSGFLGIMTGICQLIPVIGPWPIYTILAIMYLFKGNYVRLVLVVLFGCILSLSDMYIRPAISGKYADIHPLILLLGFVSGPLIMGIVGFILGPLILGVAFAVIKTYKEEKDNLTKNKVNNEIIN
ncbi:hypothetical protein BGI41_04240 [Methanobrevibacter sp. 87.7]|uniref:AI-2E family transporter n=1 Tax=Methanobrevibacter sp. 87.7 TaxID=387957 RepID=UPI000B509359|nr:AI-2E family transporter [Methanobrevibacter sp. 87.7]OWT33085.1 hypothetical protein BGI41_04240 [Methanobrevibacter sp. 87.7]